MHILELLYTYIEPWMHKLIGHAALQLTVTAPSYMPVMHTWTQKFLLVNEVVNYLVIGFGYLSAQNDFNAVLPSFIDIINRQCGYSPIVGEKECEV